MNICISTDNYPSEGKAVNVFVEQLVCALVDLGVEINVIAPQSITKVFFQHEKLLPKVKDYVTKKGNRYKVFRPYKMSFGNGHKSLYKLVGSFNAKRFNLCLSRIHPDVCYGHFMHCGLKMLDYASREGLPLFVACGEGDNALENTLESLPQKRFDLLKQTLRGVVSVSTENKRKCLHYGVAPEENITVLPNCVDTSIFHEHDREQVRAEMKIGPEDFVVVFVGGFIPRKGPDRVAKAITKLNDDHIKVMFIGKPFSGYDYDFDCSGIIYKGTANHDDLPKLLNCADIFVLPTQKEGCCNAIVEALACGLPVVSSDGPFNDDILDEDNSIRLDPMDIDGIAKAIAYLRDNRDARQKMRECSLARHEWYSIEDRAKKIKSFIEDKSCFVSK